MTYRAEIDGLRAVAVLPVILFHAGLDGVSGGFVGVDIFFVISGYLITQILLQELSNDQFSLLGFYERRARRILPALFFIMGLSLIFAWVWLLPGDMKDFSQSVFATAGFASNILFWQESGYFDSAAELKPLLHTWSLAVEEQYYIFFPLALMAFWRWMRPALWIILTLIFCVSLGLAEWAADRSPMAAFYLLPTRGWELLLGGFAAGFLLRGGGMRARPQILDQILSLLGIALMGYAIFSFDAETAMPGLVALIPTGGAVLVIICATPGTWANHVLSNRILVGIGLISYSAYLWHQPLFAFARYRSGGTWDAPWFIGLSFLALGLAYLSWRFIEQPFRNKARIGRAWIFGLSGAGILFFLGFGALGHWTNGFPNGRMHPDVAKLENFATDRSPFLNCLGEPGRYVPVDQACALGDGDHVMGALMGDSHAGAISFALDQTLGSQMQAIRLLGYNGCPPIEGLYRTGTIFGGRNRCPEFMGDAFQHLLENPALTHIVLVGRFTLYAEGARYLNDQGWQEPGKRGAVDIVTRGDAGDVPDATRKADVLDAYAAGVEKLLAAGKTVILVYPIPEQGWHVPRQAAYHLRYRGENSLSVSLDSYQHRNRAVLDRFDALPDHPDLIRIRPAEIYCDTFIKDRCVGALDGAAFYSDDDHLSNYGAQFLAQAIAKAFTDR